MASVPLCVQSYAVMLDASSVRCTIAPVSTLERVSFRFDKKLVKQLRKAAKERKQTQKVIVTEALEAWFASQEKIDSSAPSV